MLGDEVKIGEGNDVYVVLAGTQWRGVKEYALLLKQEYDEVTGGVAKEVTKPATCCVVTEKDIRPIPAFKKGDRLLVHLEPEGDMQVHIQIGRYMYDTKVKEWRYRIGRDGNKTLFQGQKLVRESVLIKRMVVKAEDDEKMSDASLSEEEIKTQLIPNDIPDPEKYGGGFVDEDSGVSSTEHWDTDSLEDFD